MRKSELYEKCIFPFIENTHVDSEEAHNRVVGILQFLQSIPGGLSLLSVLSQPWGGKDNKEEIQVFGLSFKNHIVLAEGFDKNGIAVPALLALGFGSVIVGSVTEHQQDGNPLSRVKRLPGGNILNQMGFPSDGAVQVARNLERTKKNIHEPVGISLALNRNRAHGEAAASYGKVQQTLYPYGEYFVINASSPNTQGLWKLQQPIYMRPIIESCLNQMEQRGGRKPLFIKVSPDSSWEEVDGILKLCDEFNLTGIVATNTTTDACRKSQLGVAGEEGGISGPVLHFWSTEVIRAIHTQSPHLAIIGMGGVNSGETAKEKMDAGASLIGIYSSLIFKGPSFPSELARDLKERIRNDRI
jgi:dihydroorotate dehydrogenase